jgi:TolB-like protein/class 3 adenylate cyclase
LRSRPIPSQQAEHQLAAVVAADIAGYSRMMGADEEGTLTALKACRSELIDPGIARHRGRIVKTTGDDLLIEFSSPVEAVRWAIGMQHGMIDRNADLPDDRRILFRVGINLGDVIVDDKDLYGDAINIAARLETLAEPGGVCISRVVYEQVRDRVALPFADAGEQTVKNIVRPVHVYELSADAVATVPKMAAPAASQPAGPQYARRRVVLGVASMLLVIAGGFWWLWPSSKAPSAAAARHLSIVVLPFANLTADPDQQYFADGITEDVTSDLSRIEDSFVISHSTAVTYKDKPVDTKQIGRDLGVRYVLEGSVQRSGGQIRINTQLIDAEIDAHVWAERFERDIGDLIALQDEITSHLAVALRLALLGTEAARPNENSDAIDYILRGRAAASKLHTREAYAEAIDLFEHALALNPQSPEAQSMLGLTLVNRVTEQLTDTREADLARAADLVERGVAAAPNSPIAHYAKGNLLRTQRRCEEAIPEYQAVIALDRNSAGAFGNIGFCKLMTGSIDEMIPLQEQAIRLSPRDSRLGFWYLWIGQAHLLQSQTDEAIVWLEKGLDAYPNSPAILSWLASAFALKGETERAAAELAEARKVSLDDRFLSISRLRAATIYFGVPKVRALFESTYYAGLRKAGMPEE